MAGKTTVFVRKTALLFLLLSAYFIAIISDSKVLGNILSPLNALAVSGILFFIYLSSNPSSKIRISFLLFSLAALFWSAADILWAIDISKGFDPTKNLLISLIYTVTNILLVVTVVNFAFLQFRKWSHMQLYIDTFTVGFMFIYFVWIVYLHKDTSMLKAMLETDYTSIFSLLCDVFIVMGIVSWRLSIRSGTTPLFVKIASSALVMFAVVDMTYFHAIINDSYFPDSTTDFLYILSLQLLAFGALWEKYKEPAAYNFSHVSNRGFKRNWLYMLAFPLTAAALEMFGVSLVHVEIFDLCLFAVVILLYGTLCNYVQLSLENERLLEHEKQANEILQQNVAAQINRLSFLENQDPLTTLFNRRYFLKRVETAIESHFENNLLSVLLLDIDRFKTLNDVYGHDVGDKFLLELSSRIIMWNRHGATLARLGGDEFAIIIVGAHSPKDIEKFCVEIIELCSLPVKLGQDTLRVTVSLGAAFYSDEVKGSSMLLKNAENAMYRAKSQGYNKYQFYDPFFNKQIDKKTEIEQLLRKAQIDKDFKLFYQPQFSLPDKKLIGAEALIRWKSAEHGFILPSEFIPIAEEIDYISEIGKWVMTETIRQGAKWNLEHGLSLVFGFNISVKQLADESFAEALESLASKEGFNADWIDAEITESFMISDKLKVKSAFELFRRLGISVSIDDFGSGYSSYGYLSELPFSRIKIDKSIVDKISPDNYSANQVLKAIIDMAKAVGVKTIAEGVETRKQLDILTEFGCDQVQGYLFGRPVPPDIFENKFIKKQ
jgi:diguanylate cyclase